MNYTFLPSLEHIVLVKIATSLWNQSDIRALIVKLEFELDFIFVIEIEEKIKEKILLLNTPSSLKEKILCVIKPIGLEIYRWMEWNKNSYNLAVNLPNEFSWTPHGTIDRKKTAEALMTDETIDITERYKLACIYCLENYVGALWEKMPENHRASFYSEEDPRKVAQHELVVIWTYGIKGETAKLENIVRWRNTGGRERTETCTPEQYPFICAFIHRNKVAAEYFFSKLSLEDREDSLRFIVNWATGNFIFYRLDPEYSDLLRFLFPRVNKEQQIGLFKHPCGVHALEYFLQWPWQSLFTDITNHVVLEKRYFYYLFNKIVMMVNQNYKDYDYQRLLGEFWQKSTEDYKKYIIGRLCNGDGSLLLCLFENNDMKNISLILKDASVLQKEAIYKSLKDKYMEKYSWIDYRSEKFLDDLIQKFNFKRNIEESHCSLAKRLCSSSNM